MGEVVAFENPSFNMPSWAAPITTSCNKSLSHSAPLYLCCKQCSSPSVVDSATDFEFDSHGRLSPPSYSSGHRQQVFADELFRRGELLPLKLPPRLEPISVSATCSRPSSCTTSPTMLMISTLKSPFARLRSHDEGFDPFTVALEKVRNEERVRRDRGSPRRRSRSLSPFRKPIWLWKEEGKIEQEPRMKLPLNEATTMSINGKSGSKGSFSLRTRWKKTRDLLSRSKSEEIKKRPFISCGLSPLVCFGFS